MSIRYLSRVWPFRVVDDTLGVVYTHGIAGLCGGLLVGLLADPHAHFLAHGLGLSPGADFGSPRFVRLNFGTQRSVLANALVRLERGVLDTRRD